MEYKVVYSNRKTISICVEKTEVIVRAPINTDTKTIEKLLEKYSGWINKNIDLQRKKQDLLRDRTPAEVAALKKEARVYLKEKTDYFADIMNLKYGRISITSAKKRFGSCSSAGNISYSYRLMLYPEEAREYVVVHELAHLKEMNHSKQFYDIVASVLPDYKSRKRLLK